MKIPTRQVTLVAVFLALCITVPILFHTMGIGKAFLPMFLPILLAGFLIEFPVSVLVGVLGPIISALTTGMPPLFPTGVVMVAEGFVAILTVGLCYHRFRLHHFLSLLSGVIAMRLARIIMLWLILPLFGLPFKTLTIADLTVSIPGIIMLLIVIPLTIMLFQKYGIIQKK
ncbi:hypothetical protein JW960_24975 [candidate division KSB1 bacterium]|nr:hypothetical protein [candidate division KSB1 bacterium]